MEPKYLMFLDMNNIHNTQDIYIYIYIPANHSTCNFLLQYDGEGEFQEDSEYARYQNRNLT